MDPVIVRAGEGERFEMAGSSLEIKSTAESSGGAITLNEGVLAPGFPGPPPHRHEAMSDLFYVLEGTLTMRLGNESVEVGPGTFVHARPGVVHAFSNESSAQVRFLNFQLPGGWEHYLRDIAQAMAGGGRPDPAAMAALSQKYDVIVEP